MEEIVDSNQLHADKAFYNTLSRSQQISLTRRIEFEYEKRRSRKDRPNLPDSWTAPLFDSVHHYKESRLDEAEGAHKLTVTAAQPYDEVIMEAPRTGTTNFDDLEAADYAYIESVALIHLDGILMKKNARPIKKPRKPKEQSTPHATIFEMDLAHIVERDSSGGAEALKVPVLVDEILRHQDKMIASDGIFRKSCALHTTTDLKSEIIKIYESGHVELRQAMREVLARSQFDNPHIHGALLKNLLQGLPEPLMLPGYKEIYRIITETHELADKIQLLNLIFLILPRENQHFLAKLFHLFQLIESNSSCNKMTIKNLAIVFQPNLFQMPKRKKKVTKIEELQNNLQALVGITELLIKYSSIIQSIPPSFITQLRTFNSSQDHSPRKFGKFFRRPSKADINPDSALARQLRTTLPTMCAIINENECVHMVTIKEEGKPERFEQICFDQESMTGDVAAKLDLQFGNFDVFESGGNLKSKRRLNRMANLKAIVSVNPKVQFVVTESGGLNQLY